MDVFEYGLKGVSGDVAFGKRGPRVQSKDDSGRPYLEVTETDGTTLITISAADPINATDLVTKRYLETRANVYVTGQINGGTPPAAVNGVTYMCTTSGGTYVAGRYYYGSGGAWVEVTPVAGLTISVTVPLTGGTLEFLGDHLYIWDADGSAWVDIGPGAADSKMVKINRASLVFNSAGTVNVSDALPAGSVVTKVIASVTTAFDSGAANASVVSGATICMAEDEIDLSTVGIYVANTYVNDVSGPVVINFDDVGSLAGAAVFEVQYSIA